MESNSTIIFHNPPKVVFGNSCINRFFDDFIRTGKKRLFVLSIPALVAGLQAKFTSLKEKNIEILLNTQIVGEPSFTDYQQIMQHARDFQADSVVGIGGGSVLDTAKLVAAMIDCPIGIREIIADNSLVKRTVYLACLPTTAGTGSEMSPNAIFFDPENNLKIGVISPALVPDATYIDPELSYGVPPQVTAATGLDALTHCIEAYVNKFAHPATDTLAIEGIALIGRNLKDAFLNGNNTIAREKLALGSMYGGMCLGPVNTGAVHALAYPLGSIYKIAHGVSNALLLPHVITYNLPEAVEKYAQVARALGVEPGLADRETALKGIDFIRQMIAEFGIPGRLSELGIAENQLAEMAHSAMKIQRLLKNNVRVIEFDDALSIYKNAL